MVLKKQFFLITLLATIPLSSFAGGFLIYEQANPAIGTANVGQAAYAHDASTAYFNPAGMTQLTDSQILMGAEFILPNTQFKPDHNNTFSGTNGGQATTLEPGGGLYGVLNWSPNLKFGLSITAPYGGALSYTDGWEGRYFVQDTLFLSLNLNPSVAYKVNDLLSVGAGASVEYAVLNQTSAIYRPSAPLDDGQANVKTDNYAAGFNFGVLLTPSDYSRIGLAYRSKITHNLNGDSTFLRITTIPSISVEIVEPQNIILSTYHHFNEKLAVVGEFGWNNWKQLTNTFVQIDGISLAQALDWQDTYRFGGGLEYQLYPQLKLQGGISYDTSPTDTKKRLPNLPADKQLRVGTGIIYTTKKNTRVGVQTEYVNFGKAAIHHSTALGTLSGDYGNNYAIFIATNVNFNL